MKYVALLRGIGPFNPNMRNEKLRGVFETLGYKNVQTVLSSGNVLFESGSKRTTTLEKEIEHTVNTQLEFRATTIIRSRKQLQALVDKNPFNGYADTKTTRLNVTFLKTLSDAGLKFPHHPENKSYELLGLHDGAICSIIDLTTGQTGEMMTWLERRFGKEITTRTWKTVERILKKLNES